jgi:hypothetical protein
MRNFSDYFVFDRIIFDNYNFDYFRFGFLNLNFDFERSPLIETAQKNLATVTAVDLDGYSAADPINFY